MRVVLACLVCSAFAIPAGCSFGIDVSPLSACLDHPCADADVTETGTTDSSPEGATDAPSPSPCPAGRGPAMLRIANAPSFCIDETEVTAGDYAVFLASAERPPASSLASACRGRTDFTPTGAWPAAPGRESTPVTYVDFCDAQAFCVWSGKTLCGAPTGGALDVSVMNQAPGDTWFVACGGGTELYPYGNVYDASKCNGVDHGVVTSVPVKSLAACTGTSGAFDMSGNVWEWTDTCEQDVDAATDRCFARGGAFNAPGTELTCASRRAGARNETDPTVGFRCCSVP